MVESETPAPAPSKGSAHRRSILSGIGWNFVAIIGEQVSTLVAFVVVARILGPAQFGVVVLSVALVDIMISFVRAGISEALIRIEDLTPTHLGTGFWINMTIGVAIGLGLFLLAPWVATMLNTPQVAPFLRAMTIVFPIAAAAAIAESMLARKMAFAAIARRQIIGSIIGAVIAITMAKGGFGGWSMIMQRIAIYAVGASLSISAARLIPPMRFSWPVAKEILHFSGGITSINLLYRLQPRMAELVIGFLAQPAAVALYRAAYRIVDLVNQLPMQPLMRVAFPTLSRAANDPDRFRKLLLRFIGSLSLILLPVYAGVFFFSQDLFHLLFGEKWNGAITAFSLLVIAAGLRIPFALLGPATSARGAVRNAALFSFIDVGVSILLMLATAPFGINAIAGSRILGAVILLPIAFLMMVRPMGVSLKSVSLSFVPAAATAAFLLAVLTAAEFVAAMMGLTLGLVVGLPLCAVLYGVGVLMFARSQIVEVLESIDNIMTRKVLVIGRKYRLVAHD